MEKINFWGGGRNLKRLFKHSFYEVLGTKLFYFKLSTTTGLGEFIDDVPLGGNEYYTNEKWQAL